MWSPAPARGRPEAVGQFHTRATIFGVGAERDVTRTRAVAAALIVAPWSAWAVVRLLGLDLGHPAVSVIAFTPWAAATVVVPIFAALLLRAWPAAIVAVLTAVVLALAIAGRALPGPQPTADGRRVTLMTTNLLGDHGDARAVAELVRRHRVDVLALEELTPGAVSRMRSAGITDELPYALDDSRPGTAGTGLWSRASVRRTARQLNPRRAQAPEGVITGLGLRVRAVHPNPPISRRSVRDWRSDLAAMPAARGDGTELRVLAGDFNATLDHRMLRRVIGRGYVDAADAVGAGLVWTWSANGRFKLTIDHLLVDRRIRVERVDVFAIPGSDHRAVIAVVRLP